MKEKSIKRKNRKHHNPYGFTFWAYTTKAARQLKYIRKNWKKKVHKKWVLPKGMEGVLK